MQEWEAMATDVDILEAALDQLALTGIRRTSADDVARRAGVNRATLYRRFGSREQLLAAAYLHEAGRILEELTSRVPEVPADRDADFDPATNVVAMFTEAVALMRGHVLLRRMIEIDHDQIARSMTSGAADVLAFAADTIALWVRELHEWRGTEPPADSLTIGQTLARLIHSLVLTPTGGPDLDSPAAARRYAATVVVPLVLGPAAATTAPSQAPGSARR